MVNFLAKLASETVIRISGEEKSKYLHGQITVSTENWQINKTRLAAHCDFKGKMWNSFYLSSFDDAFLISAHQEANEASLRELKKYGVFSKVTIEMADDLHVYGVAGDNAESVLKSIFQQLPENHLDTTNSEYGVVIKLNYLTSSGEASVYKCLLTSQGRDLIEEKGSDILCDDTPFNHLETLACIGNVQTPTVGEYVPQMFNLQLLDGIDFDKGCYMGQEVVARTKFLGKNKRGLFLLESQTPNIMVSIGEQLEKQIGENWRRSGQIVRVAPGATKTLVLAVLPNDTQYDDVLRLKDNEIKFTVLTHPYPFYNIDE